MALAAIVSIVPAFNLSLKAQAPPAPPPSTQSPPQAQPDPNTEMMIDALVDDLLNGDAEQFAAARRQLLQLGPVARPYLQQIQREAQDRQTRQMLAHLLKELDEAAVPAGQIKSETIHYPLTPPPITLRLEKATLDQAMGELSRVVDVPVQPSSQSYGVAQRWPALVADLDLENVTYHQATEAIGDAYGGTIRVHNGTLLYEYGQGMRPGGESAAPVSVQLRGLSRSQWLSFADKGAARDDTTLQLQVEVDPRLRLIGPIRISVDRAEDNHGNSLLAGKSITNASSGLRSVVSINLRYPQDNAGDRVRLIEGNATLEVLTEADVLTIADLGSAQNLSADLGVLRYRIVDFKPRDGRGNQYQLRLTIENIGVPRPRWQQMGREFYSLISRTLTITDSKGQALAFFGGGGGGGNDKLEYTVHYGVPNNQKLVPPLSMRWQTPRKTETLTVPFSYSDLPMP